MLFCLHIALVAHHTHRPIKGAGRAWRDSLAAQTRSVLWGRAAVALRAAPVLVDAKNHDVSTQAGGRSAQSSRACAIAGILLEIYMRSVRTRRA